MTKTQSFVLANIGTADTFGHDILGDIKQLGFIALFKFVFQLVGFVKMIGNAALVASGDKDHFSNAGGDGFFNRVLN